MKRTLFGRRASQCPSLSHLGVRGIYPRAEESRVKKNFAPSHTHIIIYFFFRIYLLYRGGGFPSITRPPVSRVNFVFPCNGITLHEFMEFIEYLLFCLWVIPRITQSRFFRLRVDHLGDHASLACLIELATLDRR